MKGRIFLDSNILLYCYAQDEPIKQKMALDVAQQPLTVVSTQVLKEVTNILKRKVGLSWTLIEQIIDEIVLNNELHSVHLSTLRKAIFIANRYQLQWFDSIIIASALEANCTYLLSEDLQHGLKIETLHIQNPFR